MRISAGCGAAGVVASVDGTAGDAPSCGPGVRHALQIVFRGLDFIPDRIQRIEGRFTDWATSFMSVNAFLADPAPPRAWASSNCDRNSPAIRRTLFMALPAVRNRPGSSFGPTQR